MDKVRISKVDPRKMANCPPLLYRLNSCWSQYIWVTVDLMGLLAVHYYVRNSYSIFSTFDTKHN